MSSTATSLKDAGNAAFTKGDHAEAIRLFSEAILLDPSNVVLYSNRSAAYSALGKKDKSQLDFAVADGRKCIELDAKFIKGYSRLGTALFLQGSFSESAKVYASGLQWDAQSKLLLDGLVAAQKYLNGDQKDGEDGEGGKGGEEKEEKGKVKNGKDVDDIVIGIDLGTTYSCVGVWREKDKGVTMIPNERGAITSPSFVCFSDTGKRFVGQSAKNMAARFPTNTLYDVKRIIGQRFEDEGVAADIDKLSYMVVPSEGKGKGKPLIQVDMGMHGKKTFAPEEISAMVLSYLKKTAEDYLGRPVTKAVITVPAYFNDSQRSATKSAGRIAGLDVLRIINEPTAAALSYGLDRTHKDTPAKVLIFDLGGGTFDVSVLSIEGGVTEVKATGGDTRLGGEDFDLTVTKFLVNESINEGKPDITEDPRAMRRLQTAVEQAKRSLSTAVETEVSVEALFTLNEKKKGESNYRTLDFSYKLPRSKFESLNMAYFNKCLDTVKKVLKDAKLKPSEIDDVVLVGGSTRIPKIQEMLQEFFGGKELCKSLNPDEAVAYGAAVQGAILNGTRDKSTASLLLLDVTPLSLGIETTGRLMSVIVPRNTSIPTTKTQTYTTEADYQTEIDVCVYEGERAKTTENNLLGQFTISGIERAKRGVPKIDVSFSLDSNGILNVSARDQVTGVEAKTQIERSGRSTDAEIDRMVREAAKYKAEDEEEMKRTEATNDLESVIGECRELISESKNAAASSKLSDATDEAEEWLEHNGETARVADIKLKRKNLEVAIFKFNRATKP